MAAAKPARPGKPKDAKKLQAAPDRPRPQVRKRVRRGTEGESGSMPAPRSGAGKALSPHSYQGVEESSQIAVLASPTRMEIVMTLEALAKPVTVAELAAELGRPADGLYYHLRALVRCGLLVEDAQVGDRRYRSTTPRGQRMRLHYRLGESGNAKAVRRVAAGMLRMAERDFARAAAQAGTVVEGPRRELWVARLRGWVDAAELAEVNRLLNSLIQTLHRPRPRASRSSKMIALTWLMAPLDARPARRGARASKT